MLWEEIISYDVLCVSTQQGEECQLTEFALKYCQIEL